MVQDDTVLRHGVGSDPYPQRTQCPFEGCSISAEEHHRLTKGMAAELTTLREKLRRPVGDDVTLQTATDGAIIGELALRLQGR